jgi:hypothetical protein
MIIPEMWVVIEYTTPNGTTKKVYAGWRGGYTTTDNWRLNSGIKKEISHDNYWEFKGYSGSTYICHKKLQGIHGVYLTETLNSILEKTKGKVIQY